MRSLKPPPSAIEQLAITRMPVKEADIVRYRVYSDSENYVAVIAENALMAMKTAEINEPYKVVRDNISGVSLQEGDLDKEKQEPWHFSTEAVDKSEETFNLPKIPESQQTGFVAMSFGELKKKNVKSQVLEADVLLQMMQEAEANVEKAKKAAETKSVESEQQNSIPSGEAKEAQATVAAQPEPQKVATAESSEEKSAENISETEPGLPDSEPLSAQEVVGLISEPDQKQ